ncbi:MAG: hypothetical protein J5545_06260 [Bacteroidaceae bacterium]|nr:hypothetical protein [Bacteroidaceae bacterium]
MKKFLFLILGLLVTSMTSARELVVTLQNGQRIAFHLSSSEDVVMTQAEGHVTLGGTTFNRAEIQEFRIFQQLPADAIPVGIQAAEDELGSADTAVYDLGGRRVADSALEFATQVSRPRAGVYLINKKKVVIR